jgi:hypothetical protein
MRKEFAFEEVIAVAVGSTRVPRVQFGVPPNCRGARGLAVCHPHTRSVCTPPVSGVTPETTRQRRVLPTNYGRSR